MPSRKWFVFLFGILLSSNCIVRAAASLTELGTFIESTGTSYTGLPADSGDLNCDGFDDLIMGDAGNDSYGSNKGIVQVFFGGSSPDSTPDFMIYGTAPLSNTFPRSPDGLSVGDINNDGCDDLVVSQYILSRIYIFMGDVANSGVVSVETADYTINGTGEYEGFTVNLADLNNDNHADLIAVRDARAGTTIIGYFQGSSPDLVEDFVVVDSGYAAGRTLDGRFDVDGDGNRDIVTSRWGVDNTMKIFRGPFSGTVTSSNITIAPVATADLVSNGPNGFIVADISGDSVSDLCVGSDRNDTAGTNRGAVFCFYGTLADGSFSVSSADLKLYGSANNVNFGRSLFNYDINNDGFQDVIVGESQYDGGADGKLHIFLGTSSGLNSTAWLTISKESANLNGRYGEALNVWDWDNDGWANIFVSEAYVKKVYFYEVAHGDPAVTPDTIGGTLQETSLTGSAEDTVPLGGVEWGITSSKSGEWNSCSAADGTFDEISEEYVCDISTLSAGAHTVYYRSFDENSVYMLESSYPDQSFTLVLDSASPEIVLDPLPSASNDATPALTGTATDSTSTVARVEFQVDGTGGAWSDCTAADGAYDELVEAFSCTVSSNLLDGTHTFYIRATDSAANVSGDTTNDVITSVDTAQPFKLKVGLGKNNLDLAGESSVVVNKSRIKLFFDTEDATTNTSQIKVSEHEDFRKANWQDYDGDMWVELSSGDEKKKLYFKFKDDAGNESDTYEQLIKVDTAEPELAITKIGTVESDFKKYTNYYYTDENPIIQGSTEKGALLLMYVDGEEEFKAGNVDDAHGYSCEKKDGPDDCFFQIIPKNLTTGTHKVYFLTEDSAGNDTEVEFELTINQYPEQYGLRGNAESQSATAGNSETLGTQDTQIAAETPGSVEPAYLSSERFSGTEQPVSVPEKKSPMAPVMLIFTIFCIGGSSAFLLRKKKAVRYNP